MAGSFHREPRAEEELRHRADRRMQRRRLDAGPRNAVAGTERVPVGTTIHRHGAGRSARWLSRGADGRWLDGAAPLAGGGGAPDAAAHHVAVRARAAHESDARGSAGKRRGRARTPPLARAATDADLVGAGIPARVVPDRAVALLRRQVRGRLALALWRRARPQRLRALARVVAIPTLEVGVAAGGAIRRSVCGANAASPSAGLVCVVAAQELAEG